ncbi:nucleotidyl transferase AbiEii/AbiGii toxin family protein [Megamonas hypermegale]|uniref:nucleotidyl transferase AbiEii/AbiGii toxin family protein n=1 Tax=Megamonas hypermegale TaxID=158847 RepID=UPI0026EE43D2|nr:nucleotidyl transferase AbiEii/AbiGii toxin family protein [Megamonas hypermegale]
MKYLSGIFALNLMCDLDTFGDWHTSAINWKKLNFWDSNHSIWGNYGIETNRTIPENNGKFNVANHIRALLDLISIGDFPTAQGMRDNFICNDKYTPEIFSKVSMLKNRENWLEIDKFMSKEYMLQWVRYKNSVGIYRENFDRAKHRKVIDDFLADLSAIQKNAFVLKGGTALLKCYGLDRFSEDISLDGIKKNIIGFIDKFCRKNGYEYKIVADTDIVKRVFINYGGDKPLKVEVSYRKRNIPKEYYINFNGINVYTIDMLCLMKINAYMSRDKLCDLYDLCYIGDRYYAKLSPAVKVVLQNALEYKGWEQFNYIIQTQKDLLIDNDKLVNRFSKLYDKIGLFFDEQQQIISTSENKSKLPGK